MKHAIATQTWTCACYSHKSVGFVLIKPNFSRLARANWEERLLPRNRRDYRLVFSDSNGTRFRRPSTTRLLNKETLPLSKVVLREIPSRRMKTLILTKPEVRTEQQWRFSPLILISQADWVLWILSQRTGLVWELFETNNAFRNFSKVTD